MIKYLRLFYYSALMESMEISKKRESSMKRIKEIRSNPNYNSNDDLVVELESLEDKYKPISEELNRDKYLGSYSSFENSPCFSRNITI